MDANDTGNLVYLVLLGAIITMYYLVSQRGNLGRVFRQALLWGLIFTGAIAAAGFYQSVIQNQGTRQAIYSQDGGQVEVTKSRDGHFHLTLDVNATPVEFVVDTGASGIVLSARDARRVGLDPDRLAYLGTASTANGTVRTARIMLDDVALGPIRDRRLPAWVNEGAMKNSLLGMSYLSRFDRIEISGNKLILSR